MLLKPVKKYKKSSSKKSMSLHKHNFFFVIAGALVFFGAIITIWAFTLKLPDFNDFQSRLVHRSTQIYDRTGKVLLYDLHKDVKRTVISLSEMSINIQHATIAVEDARFYSHHGIRPLAIVRAMFKTATGNTQGGSTITQQVIKNTLLTQRKTISRKIKEVILALKLERVMSKDQILEAYLNDSNYGGNVYGVEQASQTYFGKPAKDLSVAEAAYLASIPQSPTYYSPYGKHVDQLIERRNFVLKRMKEVGFIDEATYATALATQITPVSKENSKGIKAPHFVFYVQEYLINKYGEDLVEHGGLKVITTLDYDIQKKAEEIALKGALDNEKKFNATNIGFVALDPKTGQIISMVGSRDYFDKKIDGAYNITTALRQPGSSFKPIVYTLGLIKGYTGETILFDVPTEFNANCTLGDTRDTCYSPGNFDNTFRGAVTVRQALAQSLNIPAVKMLYLVGIKDAIKMAQDLGVRTLHPDFPYGLTLVLGGGEVRLLDMTGAFSVFAAEGVKREVTPILSIEDPDKGVLEEYKDQPKVIFSENIAREMTNILSDNNARVPAFSPTSALYFPGVDVAAKTGTTNDTRDVWVIGYTPNIVLGAWAGNNDNSPMVKKTSAMIIAPVWHELMEFLFTKYPPQNFTPPVKKEGYDSLPQILRGIWQGSSGIHDILYYINKENPTTLRNDSPYNDSQFPNWENAVRSWFGENSNQIDGNNVRGVIENTNIGQTTTQNKILPFSLPGTN